MNTPHIPSRGFSALHFAFLSLMVALSGCGSDASTDGSATTDPAPQLEGGRTDAALQNTRPPSVLDSPRWFFRVDLTRSADGVIDGSTSAIESSVRPPPIADPEYFLLGLAGTTVVSAQPVSFPSSLQDVAFDAEGAWEHESLPLTDSIVSAFIEADPSIDRVELVSADDTVLFSESVELPPEASAGVQRQQLSLSELSARYPHIRFLRAADGKKLASGFEATAIDPTDAMTDVLADGLAKIAPGMTAVTTSIAIVRFLPSFEKAAKTLGMASGSVLILNADLMSHPKMSAAIVHEIAHNFTLLSSAAATRDPELSAWPARARAAAKKTITQFRLTSGLLGTWAALHNSGVLAEVAGEYMGDAWRSVASDESARASGFATTYGSRNAEEDLAEYVSTTQLPTAEAPGICPLFAGVSRIDPTISIPYAKLTFLAAVGAIDPQSYDACIQAARLEYRDGIDFPDVISFTSATKAGYSPDGRAFGIVGEGPNTYELIVALQLPHPKASPLGLHILEDVGFGPMDGRSGAFLANDQRLLMRASKQGFVLVTEASTEVTRGAFFGLLMDTPSGMVTDHIPFGTFQIR